MQKNELFPGEILDYTHDGLGVARFHGRAVFVPQAVRGDSGILRVVKVSAKTCYAIWEVLEQPSDFRVPVDCPLFPRCGGCAFRHLRYEEELRLKAARVEETLRRLGGVEKAPARIVGAETPPVSWRNKAVYPVGFLNGRAVTGFYRPRSHDIVPCTRCLQLPESADRTAAALRDWLDQTGAPVRQLLWRQAAPPVGAAAGELACVASPTSSLPDEEGLVRSLRSANPALQSIWLDFPPPRSEGHHSENRVLGGRGRLLWGADGIDTFAGGNIIRLGPYPFHQVNHARAEDLLAAVRAYVTDADKAGEAPIGQLLDLYCGAGVIGLSLARFAQQIVGVEIVPEAAQAAEQAAARNGIPNFRVWVGDAGQAAQTLAEQGLRFDAAVVDPPRKGLDPQGLAALGTIAPGRIVYVSCDPATLARDVSLLGQYGYTLTQYTVIDMFPRTANVETVALLSKHAPQHYSRYGVE